MSDAVCRRFRLGDFLILFNSGPRITMSRFYNDKNPAKVLEIIKPCNGKAYRTERGLKMHQRHCIVLEDLNQIC